MMIEGTKDMVLYKNEYASGYEDRIKERICNGTRILYKQMMENQ